MSSTRFGSFAWARRTGGRMTSGERAAEALRGIAALSLNRMGRIAGALGIHPRTVSRAVADIPMPRTPIVAAAELAIAAAPRWVVAHSMRTYLWAALLAVRDGWRPDAEVLLVAALLHDLGLVHRDGAPCFALRGAEMAREIAIGAGAGADVADRVADAIAMHLNVIARGEQEARLLRAGAALDVVAARAHDIAASTRREVHQAWPRDGFAEALRDVMKDEANKHPDTRVGFLCTRLGFLGLIVDAIPE